MKGLIISSGEIKDYELLKRIVDENDYIVCADGGVNHLLKINKLPDIVLGDLDSIGSEELKILTQNNIEIKKFPVMKDETDTELCVEHLLQNKIKNINLMGVTGTRIDHTIANIHLLKKIYLSGAKGCIINANNAVYFTNDEIVLKKREDYYLSLIPLNKEGIIVSLDGFLYPLNKEVIEFSSTRGVSNKIIDDFGKIRIHKGDALIIESKD